MNLLEIANVDTLSFFLDSVDFNYSVIDKDGHYVVQNNKMISSYTAGLTNAELIDKPTWEHCKEVMRSGIKCIVEEKSKGRYYLSMKQPLFDDHQKCVGIRILSYDITDRKKAELELKAAKEELEVVNKAKDDFLRSMQHDLRTPLSHVVGITEVLKDNFQDLPQERVHELLNRINGSSKALMTIVDEVMSGFDIDAGQFVSQSIEFNLKEVIQSLKDLLIEGIEKKGLKLVIKYDEKIPTLLFADKVRLHRVLLNLLSNAIKFTATGTIKLSVELDRRTESNQAIVRFSVKDSGIGIPKDKIAFLYQKFSRLHPAETDQYPGRGLGLWIVDQFLKDLGGQIDVESIEGKGTTFICLIPLRISLNDASYDKISKRRAK